MPCTTGPTPLSLAYSAVITPLQREVGSKPIEMRAAFE
jgi:hypothetical protein